MDDSEVFAPLLPAPTAERPLAGLTVLVVEDSHYASEAMRLMCLRSGARIRRADCLHSARKHLRVYRPSVVIIDMGLPDGSGEQLIEELSICQPRVPVLLGTSGDDWALDAAIAAGADGVISKPITSLQAFQKLVLSHLPKERHPRGLRPVQDQTIAPDPIAYHDDIALAADVLRDSAIADEELDYVAQFLRSVARSAEDAPLAEAATALSDTRARGGAITSQAARLAGLVQDRLAQRKAI
ncbi:MAG: response regulator [Marinibacterium sp.]|nr:response regulator [Marinibacterium sp.]